MANLRLTSDGRRVRIADGLIVATAITATIRGGEGDRVNPVVALREE
jgi:hypothetical protein